MAKASTDEPHITAQKFTHFCDKYVACLKCQTCLGIILVLRQLKCFRIKLQTILSFGGTKELCVVPVVKQYFKQESFESSSIEIVGVFYWLYFYQNAENS